ncbi:MAG: hypothetical protein NTW19_04125 [Planctomycetota bacterium]|nr:hypothetical protein [Planctomycetota bacterium]
MNPQRWFFGSLKIASALTAAIGAGCASPKIVHVVDVDGRPIAGAAVSSAGPSFDSRRNTTDSKGNAPLPSLGRPPITSSIGACKPIGVLVRMAGYEPGWADIPSNWPLTVTLKPAATTQPAVK